MQEYQNDDAGPVIDAGIEDDQDRRPAIFIDGDLHRMTKLAEVVMRADNRAAPTMFELGGGMVRVNAVGSYPRFESVDHDKLRRYMAEKIRWLTVDGKGNTHVAHPPPAVVRNVLAAESWPLPRVDRLVRVPVFASDGSLVVQSGYSQSGRVYLVPEVELPELPARITASDVEKAKCLLLEDATGDFPFVSDADRAHAVAAMLLPFVRNLINGPTPLHLINAPAIGTGKGLLAKVIRRPVDGDRSGVLSGVGDGAEWRKRITSVLVGGPATVVLDNLAGHLDSAALAAALTETVWEDRRLGVSEIMALPNRALWLGTGNGVTLSDELRRRTVPILLDAGIEEPHRRPVAQFRHQNLERWISDNRGHIVWACIVLVRAWQEAGAPVGSAGLGSFESWAQTIGGILDVAGIDGFLGNLSEFAAGADPVTEGWRELVAAWADRYGEAQVRVSELLPLYDGIENDFLDLGAGNDRSQVTRLGKALTNKRDAVVCGHRLVRGASQSGSSRWRLLKV